MDIVVFGQQNWNVTWTEKQQFATRLARRGHRILYVDPLPATDTTAIERARTLVSRSPSDSELHSLNVPGLWHLSIASSGAGWRHDIWRRERAVRAAADKLGFDRPVALSFYPLNGSSVRRLDASGIVYFAVDEWTGFAANETEARHFRAQEEAMLRDADVVLGISPRLQQRFAAVHPHAYLLNNGVDTEQFAPRPVDAAPLPQFAEIARPRIGLVGQIDSRVDVRIMEALAASHPEWQIVLVGRTSTEPTLSRLFALPNVHQLGFFPHAELPHVLGELDVCLIPYHLNEHTHSCNPAKAYEYLAAGVPIVATALEGLNGIRDAVYTADTPAAFVAAVEIALADSPAARDARLRLATRQGWEQRTDELEARLEEAVTRRAAREAISRERIGNGVEARFGTRRAPMLDPKDDSDQRAHSYFASTTLSARARMALPVLRALGKVYWLARVAVRLATGRRPLGVRRILVERRAYLGDLVVFLPTLAALRARYPDARITLGVQQGFTAHNIALERGLVDDVLELDHLDAVERGERMMSAARVFARGYDLVVHGVSFFLLRASFFTGAPYEVGLDDGHPLQSELNFAVPLQPDRHETENNLAVAEALGSTPATRDRVPLLQSPLPGETPALLERIGVPSTAPILVMHPGSKRPSRRWPVERFAELASRLLAQRPGHWVVLTGVRSEHALAEAIRLRVHEDHRARVVNAAGTCSMMELRLVLARAQALICNDTGVMHVARAQGTRLLALLGPENDDRWGPHEWGPSAAISIRHEVPCSPCVRTECEHLWCLRALSSTEAHQAASQLVEMKGAVNGSEPHTSRDGTPLVALVRQHHRHTWADLAAQGFALPRVLVVVAGTADDPEGERTRELLSNQDYPYVDIIMLPANALDSREASDAPTSLTEAVAVMNSEFVCVARFNDVQQWSADRLSIEVATLVRVPSAGHVVTTTHDDGRQGSEQDRRSGDSRVFRRSAFDSMHDTSAYEMEVQQPEVRWA